MKVFLSWSKQRSQKVAELLNSWIPCIIQSVEPWISSQNIEDGELWFSAIQNQVSEIINGIVCLTKENKNEPWILFEAGGLAKGLEKSRIYILLIDLTADDILLSPLSAFNHTKPTKSGLQKLMHFINNRTIKPIGPDILEQVFDKFWPDFESKFIEIIAETEATTPPDKKSMKEDNSDILKELLKSIRSLENNVNSIKNPEIPTWTTSRKPDSDPTLMSSSRIRRYIFEFSERYGVEKDSLPANANLIYDFIKAKESGFTISKTRLLRILSDFKSDS